MNTTENPIAKFESEVREVVRSGSRSNEFEDSIKEISSHFLDLVQEELSKGSSQEIAEQTALERLGTPKSIGRQILNSPSRQTRGLRLQKLGLAGLWISAIQFLVMEYCALRGWHGPLLSTFGYSFFVLFIASALAFGFGAGLIKKVLWMPLIASFPGSILLFATARMALNPVYEAYAGQFPTPYHKLTPAPLTASTVFDYGLQYTERLIGAFIVFAAVSFLISRMWLIRLSWFRLTLK